MFYVDNIFKLYCSEAKFRNGSLLKKLRLRKNVHFFRVLFRNYRNFLNLKLSFVVEINNSKVFIQPKIPLIL